MYRQSDHRRGYGRNFSSFGRSRPQGQRRIKSFNPIDLINAPQRQQATAQAVAHAFADFKVADELQANVAARGYKTPTPIQDQAIGPILEGRDLIGIANTGTGKTAAFLIPLIDKVWKDRSQKVLIITPTRELAAQIRDEFVAFARGLNIYCGLCIGGANIARQKNDLRKNPNFVIGTPGRIQDLIRSQALR